MSQSPLGPKQPTEPPSILQTLPARNVEHISIYIHRSPADVYAYASNPQNLPLWAAGLARSDVTKQGDAWVAEAPFGKVKIKFAQANKFGVLDHDVELESGMVVHNPMRVVPNGDGSEFMFTLLRQPGMSNEQFAADAQMVAQDLQTLKTILEAMSWLESRVKVECIGKNPDPIVDFTIPHSTIQVGITFKEMMMSNNTGTVQLHRVLRAPADRVYKAFTDKSALEYWLPPYGYTGTVHEIDVRVGGGYRMSFTNFSVGGSHSFAVKYIELVANERIRHTDRFDDENLPGEMLVTIDLKTVSCGTDIRIVQEGIPSVIPVEMCYLGWQESLEQLARLVEPNIPDNG